MNSKIIVLIAFLISLLLNACGSSANQIGVVPEDLQTIEAEAEDIIDLAPSGNWDQIAMDVTSSSGAWASYQPHAADDGASQAQQDAFASALSHLQTASESKDAAETMQAANDLSAAVVELFALYNPIIPIDIGRLDVLERQVILDAARNDFSAAMDSFAKTKEAWENVKPSIVAQNGQDVADQFENSLTIQETTLKVEDAAGLTKEAGNALEIVDAMERLYQ